jgi:hypothetical protein
MPEMFQPPANLNDFNRSAMGQQLANAWHTMMNDLVTADPGTSPAFYNPLAPPTNDPPAVAAPEWTGLPRAIKRLVSGSVAAAAQHVENAISMGNPDPMFGKFTPPFHETGSSTIFAGPAYRPQDEYLEWVTIKDPDGTITEVSFTCEGPEYWKQISADQQLLLALYQELLQNNTIQLADLLFPKAVTWQNPNGGVENYQAGDYNPYNKWNIQGAVHLTQPANTLGAEIELARQATLLYGRPTEVTSDPDLICCADYGAVNRMSDPTIGSGVNTQVRLGNRVSLRNPIGLYIKGIDASAFSLPDGTPFAAASSCFEILRPAPPAATDMIVRARFRVPPGQLLNGNQLRVGDLLVNGEKIVTGGQVADVVTMTLYALAIPGAPAQQPLACKYRPCPDRNFPEYIQPIPFNKACPAQGVTSLQRNLDLAEPGATVQATPAGAGPAASRASRQPRLYHS